MGKKIPVFISTLAVLAGTLCLKPSMASAQIVKDGVNYWTLAEMLEFKASVDAEIEAKCLGDFDCEDETRYEYYERGGQYRALEMADHLGGFMITSINPGRNTITLRYTDFEDNWMRRMGIERETFDPIALYMLWVEDGKNDPWTNAQFMNDYVSEIQNGEVEEGIHVVLIRENEHDGTNWLPRGEEVEFYLPGVDLTPTNSDRKIANRLDGPNGIVLSIGNTFLSECFDSPDYRIGLDCRYMIGDDGTTAYIPMEVEKPVNKASVITGQGEILVDSSTEAPQMTTSDNSNEDNVKVTSAISSIKSPVTGVPTATQAQSIELPWWLAIIFVGGISVIFWFFWPNFKKSRKKSHKSLDKTK